ncbi:MAG TPA: ATPase, T2SS/T4P/T4SS family, partial [Dehalococcoidales bacterium]|nr:ATPase, T2SS/T4P/T4SS family [Dehalococcoidales bacterium]
MDIIRLILMAKVKGASDIHLAVGSAPMCRIRGDLVSFDAALLTVEDMERAFNELTTEAEKAVFKNNLELDFAYSVPDVVRLRCNVARQRGTICMVMRLIANTIPDIDTLRVPELCKQLIQRPRGMIIISGPTGSGKSTTLAAMLNYLNNTQYRRIV